jgi:hypothetical protein
LQTPPELVFGEPFRSSSTHSSERCGAQECNKQEIIEMAGLQRGVLAIVSKADQLAPLGRQGCGIPVCG